VLVHAVPEVCVNPYPETMSIVSPASPASADDEDRPVPVLRVSSDLRWIGRRPPHDFAGPPDAWIHLSGG